MAQAPISSRTAFGLGSSSVLAAAACAFVVGAGGCGDPAETVCRTTAGCTAGVCVDGRCVVVPDTCTPACMAGTRCVHGSCIATQDAGRDADALVDAPTDADDAADDAADGAVDGAADGDASDACVPDEPGTGQDEDCDGQIDEPARGEPVIAWSPKAEKFGVLFSQRVDGAETWNTYFTLVSTEGVADPAVLVSEAPSLLAAGRAYNALVWATFVQEPPDGEFGASWLHRPPDGGEATIRFRRLSSAGVRLDTELRFAAGALCGLPELAWNGSRYVGVYAPENYGSLHFVAIDPSADLPTLYEVTATDSDSVRSVSCRSISVAAQDSFTWVAWSAYVGADAGTDSTLQVAVLGPVGAARPGPNMIASGSAAFRSVRIAQVSGDPSTLVLYSNDAALYGTWVDSSASPVGPVELEAEASWVGPLVAEDGVRSVYAAVWSSGVRLVRIEGGTLAVAHELDLLPRAPLEQAQIARGLDDFGFAFDTNVTEDVVFGRASASDVTLEPRVLGP